MIKCRLTVIQFFLKSKVENSSSACDTLSVNGTPVTAKDLNNKHQAFIKESVYRVYQYLEGFFLQIKIVLIFFWGGIPGIVYFLKYKTHRLQTYLGNKASL